MKLKLNWELDTGQLSIAVVEDGRLVNERCDGAV